MRLFDLRNRDFGVNYSPKYIPVSGNFDSVV